MQVLHVYVTLLRDATYLIDVTPPPLAGGHASLLLPPSSSTGVLSLPVADPQGLEEMVLNNDLHF